MCIFRYFAHVFLSNPDDIRQRIHPVDKTWCFYFVLPENIFVTANPLQNWFYLCSLGVTSDVIRLTSNEGREHCSPVHNGLRLSAPVAVRPARLDARRINAEGYDHGKNPYTTAWAWRLANTPAMPKVMTTGKTTATPKITFFANY